MPSFRSKLRSDGRLFAHTRMDGEHLNGYLETHFLADGLLALYEASFKSTLVL